MSGDGNVVRKDRMSRGLLLLLLLSVVLTPAASADALPPLPPILDPASDTRRPGKFVWADLFSSDLERSRDFFAALLNWEWRWVNPEGEGRYGVFYNKGEAVAGLANYRPLEKPDRPYARWAYYLSVGDVDRVANAAQGAGGELLLPPKTVTDRGHFAIFADNEKAAVGIISSSSGDPDDFQAEVGGWIWHQLYARDAGAAGAFYARLFDYELHEPQDNPDLVDLILSSGGYARAGITQLASDSDATPQWLGMVRVDDLDAALAKVRDLGGKVVVAPSEELADGALAVVTGPVGAPLGLIRWDYPDSGQETSR